MKQQAFETNSITQSIVAFAQFARSHGMNVGLSETQDALRAADTGLLSERQHFKSALKSIWCKSPEEARNFEKLFLLFWDTNPIDLKSQKSKATMQGLVNKKTNASLVMLGRGKTAEDAEDAKNVSGANETERLKKTDLSKLGEMDSDLMDKLSQRLFKEMAMRMRRRMKESLSKGPVNLRRTIRRSLSYGGEPLELYRRAQKPRKQRLVILLDVSGSMDKYSHYLLRFICSLREQFRQLEAFIFSTSLLRCTKALKFRQLNQMLATIGDQAENWSGGTRIGACLLEFKEKYGKQLLNGSPTVLILSDGLDTGDPEQLGTVLKYIKGRAKRIIWLNPLKGMKGYKPTARGMKAALPAIDEFRPAHNLECLLALEKYYRMLDQFLTTSQELRKKQEPFAIAIVVRREAPSSGKTGDKAIVNKFGDIIGWVGGGCVRAIIIKEAEDAMRSGKARLVRIGNSINKSQQDAVMEYKMTCQSEGTVEVFIEPVLPLPHLVVMGKTAIAKALVRLAKACGFKVTAVAADARIDTFEKPDELITRNSLEQVNTTSASSIVVATQGDQDEAALEQALAKPHGYLGFVSSRKKGITVKEYLMNAGGNAALISAIKAPAGIDIHAKSPEEVAISILAEVIAVKSQSPGIAGFTQFDETRQEAGKPKFYINPVCGVPVDINNPKHIIEYQNEKVYFCCDGCKTKFELEPGKYMTKAKA